MRAEVSGAGGREREREKRRRVREGKRELSFLIIVNNNKSFLDNSGAFKTRRESPGEIEAKKFCPQIFFFLLTFLKSVVRARRRSR